MNAVISSIHMARTRRRVGVVAASISDHWSLAGLLVMLAVSASCLSQKQPDTGPAPRHPVALLGVPENRLIRWPSIAVLSDTVFVAANVFPIRGDSLDARPAYIGRLRQSSDGELIALPPLELPPGDFQFAYPRVIPVSGSLHMVWAEFASHLRMTTFWGPASFETSLWHSVLTKGIWSQPERIAASRRLVLDDETGGVAVDVTGALHVAVWDGDSIQSVRHIRLSAGQLATSRLPYTGSNPATAIAAHGDTLVIGLVAEASDTERVMVVESTDQGKNWINPIVAARRVGGSVVDLALTTTADGQLLAIGEKPPNSFYLDTIRVLRVTGRTGPSVTQLITPPPTTAALQVAMAPCAAAVMLMRTFSLSPQVFELTIPRDSPATVSRPVLGDSAIAVFSGIASSRRSVIAVFAYKATKGAPAQSVAMTLRDCSP